VQLVDRSEERVTLNGALARASEGYSGALVLRGEPGVGKTAPEAGDTSREVALALPALGDVGAAARYRADRALVA
jgi:hypothetical protein